MLHNKGTDSLFLLHDSKAFLLVVADLDIVVIEINDKASYSAGTIVIPRAWSAIVCAAS